MKFFGIGVVWDKENNKALCSFENGELETNDERTIEKLSGLGYKSDVLSVENKDTGEELDEETKDTDEEVDHIPEAEKMVEETPEVPVESETPEVSEETKNTTLETPKKSKR